MKNNATLNEAQQPVTSNEVFKVTALLYLQEALAKQEYESCKELVAIAKKLGAQQGEIDQAIAAFLRGDKPGGQGGAKQKKNRLGLLTQEQ